jgi:hypothetical protein
MDVPPLEWLLDCSDKSLQDLELAAMDRGARHLKGAKADWNEAVSQMAIAEVARYFREHRSEIMELARRTIDTQAVLQFPSRKRA